MFSRFRSIHIILLSFIGFYIAGSLLALWLVHHVPSQIYSWDSYLYQGTALAILQDGKFAVGPDHLDQPQTVIAPGYPLFLAGIFGVAGVNAGNVIFVQILLGAGSLWLTYLLATTLWDARIGLISVILVFLDGIKFVFTQKILTETLFTFSLLITILLGVKLLLNQGSWKLLAPALGFSLAIGTLIRPINYYFFLPVLLCIFIFGLVNRYRFKRIVTILALVAFPYILIIGGWQVRNYLVTGSAQYSQIEGYNLYLYRAADVVSLRDRISLSDARDQLLQDLLNENLPPQVRMDLQTSLDQLKQGLPVLAGSGSAELEKLCRERAASIIIRNPGWFALSTIQGMAKMILVPGENSLTEFFSLPDAPSGGALGDLRRISIQEYLRKWLGTYRIQFLLFLGIGIYLMILYVGAILGTLKSIKWGPGIFPHLLIWMAIFYFIFLAAGAEAYARFRIPVMPFFAIYAGKGLFEVLFVRNRKQGHIIPLA